MSPPPSPPTAKTKRWRSRMTLLQNALSAREAMNRATVAMDNMVRQLFEEEEEAELAAGPDTPRPSERPTIYHEALTGNAFVKLVLRRWAESNTDEKRDAVRALARKGHETKTISDAELAELEKQLR